MKNGYIHLLFFLSVLLLVDSCAKPFDLTGRLEENGVIYISSIMDGDDDFHRVRAGITHPIAGESQQTVSSLSIDLEINGKEVLLEEDPRQPAEYDNEKLFLFNGTLAAGDQVRIRASADGCRSVEAQTTFIPPLPEMNVEKAEVSAHKKTEGNPELEHCLQFKIALDEKPSPDSYYAIQVRKFIELDTSHYVPEENDNIDILMANQEFIEPLCHLAPSSDLFQNWRSDIVGFYDGGMIQLFDASAQKGSQVSMEVLVKYDERKELTGLAGPGSCVYHPRYKLVVSRVSPEFYRYFEKSSIGRDDFFLIGGGYHTCPYTNVIGGLGILATRTIGESEWIYN